MDSEQLVQYGDKCRSWLESLSEYGKGWDEDAPEIPVGQVVDVQMVDYRLGGLFKYSDGQRDHLFTQPVCEIACGVRKVKAHMNRLITSLETAYDALSGGGAPADVWEWATKAVGILRDSHHGSHFRVIARGDICTRLSGHATGIPSSQVWRMGFGYGEDVDEDTRATQSHRFVFEIATTVFTTCPFILHETLGRQSHTQRSHVNIRLETTEPVTSASIMREINTRLVPVMSAMKIPDEIIQVAKSYAGPTFTEDAAVRVVKIMRGIVDEFVSDCDCVLGCTVKVVSEDSHLAHDVVSVISSRLD